MKLFNLELLEGHEVHFNRPLKHVMLCLIAEAIHYGAKQAAFH